MSRKISPLDAFLKCWAWCWPRDHYGPRSKPGWVIEKQSPEVREALQNLTSDELNKLRVERWDI